MSGSSRLPWARPFQVGLRTLHILAMGLVLGGIAYGAAPGRLHVPILLTVVSGLALFALDLAKGSSALTHLSGASVILKLAFLGAGNLFPADRLGWYLAASAVASVGSHMPGTWRHFSLTEGKVVKAKD